MINGPHRYDIGEHRIKCTQCDHQFFSEGKAQLNTSGLTFFNLDWANKTATTLACIKCGYLMWFVKKIKRVPNI